MQLSKLMLKSGSNGAARRTPSELPKLMIAKPATEGATTATAVAGMCDCQRIAYYMPSSLPQGETANKQLLVRRQ